MTSEDTLMRHVASGLAGWISFQHAAGRRSLSLEHFLYPPMFEIAFGQKWTVAPQFPLPAERANPKTIDFLFRRNRTIRKVREIGLAGVEVKRVRSGTTTDFWRDAVKLRKINEEHLRLRRHYGELHRYLVLIGAYENITEYFGSRREGARRFRKEFGDQDLDLILKGSRSERGWRRRGPLLPDDKSEGGRHTVLVFKVDE